MKNTSIMANEEAVKSKPDVEEQLAAEDVLKCLFHFSTARDHRSLISPDNVT